ARLCALRRVSMSLMQGSSFSSTFPERYATSRLEYARIRARLCVGDNGELPNPLNLGLLTAPILRTTVSLRRLPRIAAFVPEGTVEQRAGARRPDVPQRPGPLHDGALVLLLESRTRWA